MTAATVKWPGIEVTLGGQPYVLPPLPIWFLEQHEDLDFENLKGVPARLVVDAVHASLARNYPAMTREDVANLVDVSNMGDLFVLTLDASGLRRKEGAEATGKPNPPWDLAAGGWMSSSTSAPAPAGRSPKSGRSTSRR